MNEAFAESERQ